MTVQAVVRHTSVLAYGEITMNAPVKEGLERAGLYRKDLDFDARNVAPDEQIAGMAKAPLAFQPGTTWNYSVSTDMLGRVVEKASGKRLADFLDERLFKPLGMKDSGFWVPAAKMPGVAAVPGAAGEYMWAGYGGTYFWVDPKEQVTAVLMTQAASPQRAYFRKQVKQLVYQAITD